MKSRIEIADAMNTTESAVHNLIVRGLSKIRKSELRPDSGTYTAVPPEVIEQISTLAKRADKTVLLCVQADMDSRLTSEARELARRLHALHTTLEIARVYIPCGSVECKQAP